jgi:hypothetical protein
MDERVGARVRVRSEGDWYKALIVDASKTGREFRVHYYGWDDSYDEWVTAKMIRWPRTQARVRPTYLVGRNMGQSPGLN